MVVVVKMSVKEYIKVRNEMKDVVRWGVEMKVLRGYGGRSDNERFENNREDLLVEVVLYWRVGGENMENSVKRGGVGRGKVERDERGRRVKEEWVRREVGVMGVNRIKVSIE